MKIYRAGRGANRQSINPLLNWAKNEGMFEKPEIIKQASDDFAPSGDLSLDIVRLASGLRQHGLHHLAKDIEDRFFAYKKAEKDLEDQTGPEIMKLLEDAHPEGNVKIVDSKQADGDVQTTITEHKMIMDVVNKQPKIASLAEEVLKKKAQDEGESGPVSLVGDYDVTSRTLDFTLPMSELNGIISSIRGDIQGDKKEILKAIKDQRLLLDKVFDSVETYSVYKEYSRKLGVDLPEDPFYFGKKVVSALDINNSDLFDGGGFVKKVYGKLLGTNPFETINLVKSIDPKLVGYLGIGVLDADLDLLIRHSTPPNVLRVDFNGTDVTKHVRSMLSGSSETSPWGVIHVDSKMGSQFNWSLTIKRAALMQVVGRLYQLISRTIKPVRDSGELIKQNLISLTEEIWPGNAEIPNVSGPNPDSLANAFFDRVDFQSIQESVGIVKSNSVVLGSFYSGKKEVQEKIIGHCERTLRLISSALSDASSFLVSDISKILIKQDQFDSWIASLTTIRDSFASSYPMVKGDEAEVKAVKASISTNLKTARDIIRAIGEYYEGMTYDAIYLRLAGSGNFDKPPISPEEMNSFLAWFTEQANTALSWGGQ